MKIIKRAKKKGTLFLVFRFFYFEYSFKITMDILKDRLGLTRTVTRTNTETLYLNGRSCRGNTCSCFLNTFILYGRKHAFERQMAQ